MHNPVPHFHDNRRLGPGFIPAEVDCTEELLIIFIDANGDNPFRVHRRYSSKNVHALLQGYYLLDRVHSSTSIPYWESRIADEADLMARAHVSE